MDTGRKRFQGVLNILHFNWPFFAIALLSWALLAIAAATLAKPWSTLCLLLLAGSVALTLLSLAVSLYVYDGSGLYQLPFLANLIRSDMRILNINAGFDETSVLLERRFHPALLNVWDFYDPVKHTEPSIARARAAFPPFPGTITVRTDDPPRNGFYDRILLTFAAHEIRNDAERIAFFDALRKQLAPEGRIIVTEHLRDAANMVAYHFGVLHFLSRANWLRTFRESALAVEAETKFTPFVTTFVLHAAAP